MTAWRTFSRRLRSIWKQIEAEGFAGMTRGRRRVATVIRRRRNRLVASSPLVRSGSPSWDRPLGRLLERIERMPPVTSESNSAPALRSSPMIAVIVPVTGDAPGLEACLGSIRSQTHGDWRCYLVDDASASTAAAACERFARLDDRFVVLRHGRAVGPVAACNTAVLAADEELLTIVEPSVRLLSRSLARRIGAFRVAGSTPAVAGAWGSTVATLAPSSSDPELDIDDPCGAVHIASSDRIVMGRGHEAIVRRELILRFGGLSEVDDIWLRLASHGYVLVGASGPVAARHPGPSMFPERATVDQLDAIESRRDVDVSLERGLAVDAIASMAINRQSAAAATVARLARLVGHRLAGGDDALTVIGELLPDERPPSFALVHPHLEREIWAGLDESLGLVPGLPLPPPAGDRLGRAVAHSASVLRDHLVSAPEPIIDPSGAPQATARREPDLAVVAENAADVEALWSRTHRARVGGSDVVAVDLDGIKGDEGTVAAWAAHDVEVLPWTDVALGRVVVERLVVRRPLGPFAAALVELVQAHGGRVEELPTDESPARLSCNASEALMLGRAPVALGEAEEGLRTRLRRGLAREEGGTEGVTSAALQALRARHDGETCVVIGNGPSLNQTDLELLRGVPTIGVNGIFYAEDRLPDPITYYVVEDSAFFVENIGRIRRVRADHRLFPTEYRSDLPPSELDERTMFFRMNAGFYGRGTDTTCHPRFSNDVSQRVFCGQSVTIVNLQLAHWMGFKRVVLIGMDFSYQIPSDAIRRGSDITSTSEDPNHFNSAYFGRGRTWKDPMLDRVLACYALAGEVYDATGREIVNATVGGALEAFPRLSLAEALR